MGLQNLLNRLKSEVSDTPDTSEKSPGYQQETSIHAGCTRDTSDTPHLDATSDDAANDPTPLWRVSIAPGTPPDALKRIRAASLVLDKTQSEAGPDRWCWPHSSAMNSAELDLFATHLRRYTDRGMPPADGEALANRLAVRDRDLDDRRVCIECAHLLQGRRCKNWQSAGIGAASVSADLVQLLQRCDGFSFG